MLRHMELTYGRIPFPFFTQSLSLSHRYAYFLYKITSGLLLRMDMPTGDRAENWSACKLVNPVAHVTNSAATNVMMTGARTRVHFGFRSTEFVVEGVDVQQRNGYRQYLEGYR